MHPASSSCLFAQLGANLTDSCLSVGLTRSSFLLVQRRLRKVILGMLPQTAVQVMQACHLHPQSTRQASSAPVLCSSQAKEMCLHESCRQKQLCILKLRMSASSVSGWLQRLGECAMSSYH